MIQVDPDTQDFNFVEVFGAGRGQQQGTVAGIDLAVPGPGQFIAQRGETSGCRQVNGGLDVLQVTSQTGSIHLTVNDSARSGEDLRLLAMGTRSPAPPCSPV